MSNVPFMTLPQIAAATGATMSRVRYAVLAKRISPSGRVGATWIYSLEDGAKITEEVKRLSDNRPASSPPSII